MGKAINEPFQGPPGGLERPEWRQLAALEMKLADGENLTYEEKRSYKRLAKKRNDGLFAEMAGAVPQKLWANWSGRHGRILIDQEARYGFPVGRAEISLPAFVKYFHDWLAENIRKLNALGDDGESGESSEALEEQRRVKTQLLRLQLQRERKEVIPRGVVHDSLLLIASMLRQCGEVLQRQFGREPAQALNEYLDDIERQIDETLAGMAGDDADDGDKQS